MEGTKQKVEGVEHDKARIDKEMRKVVVEEAQQVSGGEYVWF